MVQGMELQKMPHLHTLVQGEAVDGQQPPHGQRPGETLVLTPTSPQTKKGQAWWPLPRPEVRTCALDGIRLESARGKNQDNEFNFVRKMQSL